MKLARMIVALAFLGVVLGSIATSIPATAIAWHGERIRFEHFTAAQREHEAAKEAIPLDPRVFDAWRDRLRPNETFALNIDSPDKSANASVKTFARFALLPHVQVAPGKADALVSLVPDPKRPGLLTATVTRGH